MIDVTRAVELGWVEWCPACKPIRDAARALEKASRAADGYDTRCRALGLGRIEIECESCGSRGWNLTGEGQQLVDLVQQLYPEIVTTPKGQEIPF